MEYFLLIIAIPFLIAATGFLLPIGKGSFQHIISWKEFLILIGISALIAVTSMGIIYYRNTTFTEMWNGLVNSKKWVKVDCEHSYECNCWNDCDSKGNCTRHCMTCYEHDFDISWMVYDTAGHEFEIDRIDRQGLKEPERWTIVKIGDPTTKEHTYTDYIKASKGSLFKKETEYPGFNIPPYPGIYDYYQADKLLAYTVIDNLKYWQRQLAILNGGVGPSREANVILVIVKNQDPKFYYALQQKWVNGSQNDIVVMISVDNNKQIQWANTLCLAQYDIFRVKLRDGILAIGTLDMEKILKEINTNVMKYFKRKDMKNFEYLRASVMPTFGQLITALIVNIIICCGFTWFFYNDSTLDN
jgi:hypothetical protein